MEVNKIQVKKILTTPCTFSQLGFNLLITRLTGMYSKNNTDQMLQQCMDEINLFLKKYQIIMQKDYDLLNKL
ncbi:MAG: hypothetical protein WCP73_02355 [Eubacteriales bacterium]